MAAGGTRGRLIISETGPKCNAVAPTPYDASRALLKVGGVLSACVPVRPPGPRGWPPLQSAVLHASPKRSFRASAELAQHFPTRPASQAGSISSPPAGSGSDILAALMRGDPLLKAPSHEHALEKRFGEAKPHMTFRPIPEAPLAIRGGLAQVALRPPESPRLEGDPSALPMGEPGQVPGGRGIRTALAPPGAGMELNTPGSIQAHVRSGKQARRGDCTGRSR